MVKNAVWSSDIGFLMYFLPSSIMPSNNDKKHNGMLNSRAIEIKIS